jgi:hypothetical protein
MEVREVWKLLCNAMAEIVRSPAGLTRLVATAFPEAVPRAGRGNRDDGRPPSSCRTFDSIIRSTCAGERAHRYVLPVSGKCSGRPSGTHIPKTPAGAELPNLCEEQPGTITPIRSRALNNHGHR